MKTTTETLAKVPSNTRPLHRQYLREIIPTISLAPETEKSIEWKIFFSLVTYCFIIPLLVLVYTAFSKWSIVATPLSILVQLLGAVRIFYYMYVKTPKSFTILEVSLNIQGKFDAKFPTTPNSEDLESVINELDKPAVNAVQNVADFFVSNSPFKWSSLLFVAAFGTNILPLLDTRITPENIGKAQSLAGIIGLLFAMLELGRVIDRLLHKKRLDGAREWLKQIKENSILPVFLEQNRPD